jgi:hypothetical protein
MRAAIAGWLRAAALAGLLAFAPGAAAQEPRPLPPAAADVPDQVETPAWARRVFRPQDWNINYQATFVEQGHPGFRAAYDGPNSLVSHAETGHTFTTTLFLGYRPWKGGELFFNPEALHSAELSGLHGLGGMSNAENQKGAAGSVRIYSARAFLRQTFDVGGDPVAVEAGPNQFPGTVASRRFVLTVGQMALTDIFQGNTYAHDGRTQFMNWSFMAHAASDFAADARGYTVGLALEYDHDDWAFRAGHFAQPIESNGLALDYELWRHFGTTLEIEHDHAILGRSGKVVAMGFVNWARMGAFADAIAWAKVHGGAPDVANVRRDQAKPGFGVSIEQALTRDLGIFGRLSWNDGRTEEYAFAAVDFSVTAGASMAGRPWRRPGDTVGVAFAQNGISDVDRAYLAAGGLGAFVGDGRLPHYLPERILEAYYQARVWGVIFLAFDFQEIWNPAYNADRGPVSMFAGRLHVEF